MKQNPEKLAEQVKQAVKNPGRPPLETWNPELSGDMDLRIARDGQWIYQGEPLAADWPAALLDLVALLSEGPALWPLLLP
ncbi:DUF1285 domain-containing protein, partial [Marinobacter sp.]|uniref:DUF1285 domain-containing protein n=1 Tax=Marinobacter sp. TaxID=50741 RepID=UPI0035C7368E